MKQIKLKEEAPWDSVTLKEDYIIYKNNWVPCQENIVGFIGIAHLVEYREEPVIINEEPKIEKKNKKSIVPDPPNEDIV
jgi:hypothetical protein